MPVPQDKLASKCYAKPNSPKVDTTKIRNNRSPNTMKMGQIFSIAESKNRYNRYKFATILRSVYATFSKAPGLTIKPKLYRGPKCMGRAR